MPTTTERTWRLQIFTDLGRDPRIEFLREQVKAYDDGDHKRLAESVVSRSLSAIADKALPEGITLRTYGDLAALIAACGHQLAGEDAAAAAAEAARLAAEETDPDGVVVEGVDA